MNLYGTIKSHIESLHIRESRFVKNSSIYIFVAISQKAISFFLLPIYTIYLNTFDYGLVNIVNTIMGIVSVLSNLSLHGAASRFHYIYSNDPLMQKRVWGTSFLFVICNSLFLTVLLCGLHSHLLDPFAKNINFFPFIFIGLISTELNAPYLFLQTYLQTIQNGRFLGVINLFYFITNVIFILLFVILFKLGAIGILAANLVTNVFFFIFSFQYLLRRFITKIDFKLLKKLFIYAIPLVPYNLSSFLALMADRLLINISHSVNDVGIYSVGFQFANIVSVIILGIGQAYSAWFFTKWESGSEGKNQISLSLPILSTIFSFIGLVMALYSPFILKIMVSSAFQEAWVVIPLMSMGFSINGIYILVSNGLFVKKTYFLPLLTFIGMTVSIILNILLIPRFGIIGAAISNLFYNILLTTIALFTIEKIEHIGYKKMNIFAPFLICLLLSFFSYFLKDYSFLLRFFVSTFILFVVAVSFSVIFQKKMKTFVNNSR